MPRERRQNDRQWQRGQTLIEALIALLVMSVGLLGIASAQLHSLRFSQSAFEKSIAVLQANSAIERLWAGACDLYEGPVADRRLNPVTLDAISDAWRADHSLVGDGNSSFAMIEAMTSVGGQIVFTITLPIPGTSDPETEDVFYYQTTIPDLQCDTP